jgi:hypothetical protein
MKDELSKIAGKAIILNRHAIKKKGILYPVLGTTFGLVILFAAFPGGKFLGDLFIAAIVGETVALVAAAKDPSRKDTF